MLRTIGDSPAWSAEKGPDTVALVYYAGHGLQVDGENYLVPVDADDPARGRCPAAERCGSST